MADDALTFMIEDAEIRWLNFEGKEGMYNKAGDRNFVVMIPEEIVGALVADGWNVKFTKPREDDEEQVTRPYIEVSVRFDVRPPRITMITSTARTILTEETCAALDFADIEKVDLICRGYRWEVNGKSGLKAYLQTMFVTIQEDELQRKYAIREES